MLKKENDDILFQIYKLFYNDTPQFEKETYKIKTQLMTFILNHYDLEISDSYRFTCSRKGAYPSSINLSFDMIDMENKKITPQITIREEYIEKVKIISEEIHNYMSNYPNKINALMMISRIYYYLDTDILISSRKKSEIKKAFKYSEEEIKNILTLSQKIRTLKKD